MPWPLLSNSHIYGIESSSFFHFSQVEFELMRDYTSHFLCKQVLQPGPHPCTKSVNFDFDFDFDLIAGQIQSLMAEDSLKDVDISFG